MAPAADPPLAAASGAPLRLVSIQCLRGVAAALVVLYHAHGALGIKFPGYHSVLNNFFALRDIGVAGVDIFFVISGFIMVYVNHGKFGRRGAAPDFLVRRLIRIVPLYWLISVPLVLLLAFAPQTFSTLRFQPLHALESLLFVPTVNSAGEFFPVLNVGWTLSYELYFYLIFAAFLGTSLRFSIGMTALLFGASVAVGRLGAFPGPLAYMMLNDILVEFVLGECIAWWIISGGRLPRGPAWLLFFASVTAVAAQVFLGPDLFGHSRLFGRGLPAAALVLSLVMLEHGGGLAFPRWLMRVGDESYSLYLSHIVVSAVFFKLVLALRITDWLPADWLVPLVFFTAVLAARQVYRFLERPITRRLNRAWRAFFGRRMPAPAGQDSTTA